MSLSLSSCDNLNQMPRVTELRKRVMVVVMCVCACVCVSVCQCPDMCGCAYVIWRGSKVRTGGEGRKGRDVPSQESIIGGWGWRGGTGH